MNRKLSILLPVLVTATTLAFALGTLRSSEQSTVTQTPIVRAAPASTARLHVTVGKSNEPLVGAQVRWIGVPTSGYGDLSSQDGRSTARDSLLADIPALATSDEHGDVEVVLDGKSLLVEARSGPLWGAEFLDAAWLRNEHHSNPPDLHVELDFDLSVKVLDAHGAPVVGVPVAIRSGEGAYTFDRSGNATDANGMVTLRHAGHDMNAEASGSAARFSVAVSGCLLPAVAATADTSQAPSQPIELRLPPTGEVELVFEEADGGPIPIQGGAALVTPRDPSSIGPEPKPFPFWSWQDAGTDVVRAPESSAVVFRHVSLGSHWMAWAQRNPLSAPARREIEGPSKESERVRIVIHPPEVAQIRGQFLDDKQKPRAGVEVGIRVLEPTPEDGLNYSFERGAGVQERQLGDEGPLARPMKLKADAQGRFRLDLDRSQFENGDVRLAFIEEQGTPSERCVIATLEQARSPDEIDLGALTLVPTPIVVAGMIHDEAGVPLGGVDASVLDNGGGLVGQRFRTTSAADGTFRLIGACLDKRVDVHLTGEDLVEQILPGVEVGSARMQIVMKRAGRIRGHVVVPAGIEVRSALIWWTPEGAADPDGVRCGSTNPDEDATFEISGLAPGSYSLHACWNGSASNPGLFRKRVRVEPGMIADLGVIQATAEGK